MSGRTPKDAKDQIPFCDDQGMPNLCGAAARGVAVQHLTWPMESGGVVVFADVGLSDMEVDAANGYGGYVVLIQNQTDVADEGTVAEAAKLPTQITVAGPDVADVLDIAIIGQLKGQLK